MLWNLRMLSSLTFTKTITCITQKQSRLIWPAHETKHEQQSYFWCMWSVFCHGCFSICTLQFLSVFVNVFNMCSGTSVLHTPWSTTQHKHSSQCKSESPAYNFIISFYYYICLDHFVLCNYVFLSKWGLIPLDQISDWNQVKAFSDEQDARCLVAETHNGAAFKHPSNLPLCIFAYIFLWKINKTLVHVCGFYFDFNIYFYKYLCRKLLRAHTGGMDAEIILIIIKKLM